MDPILKNEAVQKLKLSKNFNIKSCFNLIFSEKSIYNFETVSEFSHICPLHIAPFQKIKKILWNLISFKKKLSLFCITKIDTPQPKSCKATYIRSCQPHCNLF